MKIKQEDGTEIEVFTQAELDARVESEKKTAAEKAVEDFKAANPDKTEEINALKDAVEKKEEELKAALAAGGSEGQIARLRKERDDAIAAASEGMKAFEKRFENFQNEVLGDTKKEMLDKLDGGDAELRKKIELEFNKYNPDKTSRTEIIERMEKAYLLATGDKPTPGFMDGVVGAGDRGAGGGVRPAEKKGEQTENGKNIAKVLGISDADRKSKEDYDAYLATKTI